ncbi:MAG: class I SAM-dependent methyltransferase [Actinomycetota bacterium]|nr:class I SAM-dependent methyltransferase [Actinomycetota bacterium]
MSHVADDWESHWTDYASSAEQNPAQAWRRKLVIEALSAGPSATIIDIGSGQGDFARDLLRVRPDVAFHGLELSVSGVEKSRTKVPAGHFHQVDLLASTQPIPELERLGDVLVCTEVLEHVDEPALLLASAVRYGRPGAQVLVTVPGGPRTAFDRHIGHRRHYTRVAFRELLTTSGLEVESVEAAGFPFFNLYRAVVFARGSKLIEDVGSQALGTAASPATAFALKAFSRLFRLNRPTGRLGWQLIAIARVPEPST